MHGGWANIYNKKAFFTYLFDDHPFTHVYIHPLLYLTFALHFFKSEIIPFCYFHFLVDNYISFLAGLVPTNITVR